MTMWRVIENATVSPVFNRLRFSPPFIYEQALEHAELRELLHSHPQVLGHMSIPVFTAQIVISIHGKNPHVPSVHTRYRYVEVRIPMLGASASASASSASASAYKNASRVIWWY